MTRPREPIVELSAFSSPGATATAWPKARNTLDGLDLVVEGEAIRTGTDVLVYRVTPVTAFGFGQGTAYSQTRFRFNFEQPPM